MSDTKCPGCNAVGCRPRPTVAQQAAELVTQLQSVGQPVRRNDLGSQVHEHLIPATPHHPTNPFNGQAITVTCMDCHKPRAVHSTHICPARSIQLRPSRRRAIEDYLAQANDDLMRLLKVR